MQTIITLSLLTQSGQKSLTTQGISGARGKAEMSVGD